MQKELIVVIGKVNKLSKAKACEALMLERRRYYRWLNWKPSLPKLAWNRITPQEETAILEAGSDERLCDLRAAGLMVYGHDAGKFHCSVSTVQRVLARNKLPYLAPLFIAG